jgi:hypothetical protein
MGDKLTRKAAWISQVHTFSRYFGIMTNIRRGALLQILCQSRKNREKAVFISVVTISAENAYV